jgi:hypothetical protein
MRITLSCSSRVLRSSWARPSRSLAKLVGVEVVVELAEHGLGDDQLADQVDQRIDLGDIDADRRRGRRAAASPSRLSP